MLNENLETTYFNLMESARVHFFSGIPPKKEVICTTTFKEGLIILIESLVPDGIAQDRYERHAIRLFLKIFRPLFQSL